MRNPTTSEKIATNSIDEVIAQDADAVIYAPLIPNVAEVTALLLRFLREAAN